MAMNSRIEFYQDAAGLHRFRIMGGNGELVHSSEGYDSAGNAQRGFETLHKIVQEIWELSAEGA